MDTGIDGSLHSFSSVTEDLDRRRFISMGFERIEALLSLLDNPERTLDVVQVVGTNGKGTTAVALSAALEEAGESTGTYLSPHLISYAERVRLRGEQVPEDRFAVGMGEVIRTADEHGIGVTQFELLTAGALAMFRGVRWAVLEAGLGARYDATTAARPRTVVLTNVSLDHTEYLGESVEEIAREKLASLPLGGTLILGSDDRTLLELAREECEKKGARLLERPSSAGDLPRELAGLPPYAAEDTLLGFRAAEILLDRGLGEEALSAVARRVRGALPGRFEVHELDGVPVVVDGGHNAAGVRAAVEAVKSIYPGKPIGVVFGVLRDKDIGSMLVGLREEARTLVLTRPDGERAADPVWVSREHHPRDSGGRRAGVEPDIGRALGAVAGEMKGLDGVVLVTGSLFTGAGALGWLRKERR